MNIPASNFKITGLSAKEVLDSRRKYGSNNQDLKKDNPLWEAFKNFIEDPMVILLLTASLVYFVSGKADDGIFLLSAVVLVTVISAYQSSRSRIALDKLKDFTQPHCKVIRDENVKEIASSDLVIGDSLMVEEGMSIAADGIIIHSNDFSVNESLLTGESFTVYKDKSKNDNLVYQGTTVASGLAIVSVTSIGSETKLGKIGKSLTNVKSEKTPLETQIRNFVKIMVLAGAVVFISVWLINYFKTYDVLDSLLKSLTLAMSIIPEEIPVAFTTFMALGAWRLMKMGIVVKQMKTVETLGSATIICTDKTGTITENRMQLSKLFVLEKHKISDAGIELNSEEKELIRYAMFASEPIPFDPMEAAIHEAYIKTVIEDERAFFKIIHEYPLGGKPPMMTHIHENEQGDRIIVAKGAPEALINASELSSNEKKTIDDAIVELASEGYRVLAIGEAKFAGNNFPLKQQEFKFKFKGMIAFYDPPKKNIEKVFQAFYSAGIDVKIVTGDNSITTEAIAKQTGFYSPGSSVTGDELMSLDENELKQKVSNSYIFTRMFPEAKLKIINALKANNEVVAMTGDGVNDAPALKAAHIGIAMGKKGTEIAKQAASLILIEDDLSKMIDAISMGRRIYDNLKKAIQYIISIHIPVILNVFIPLALGWKYPSIFSPVHIIFFELIMGPTCSIVFENEPIEKNTMTRPPRLFSNTFFNRKELATSILQGLIITIGSLSVYTYSVNMGYNELVTRTMVFTVLISANIFLTLVNRSFYYSFFTTLRYKNDLILLVISGTIILSAALLYFKPLATFFEFEHLSVRKLVFSIGIGCISAAWYEIVKLWKRKRNNGDQIQ